MTISPLACPVLVFCVFLGHVSAWKVCLPPHGETLLDKPISSDVIESLEGCRELNTNELIMTAAHHNSLLVLGALSPADLKPLVVIPLRENMFLIRTRPSRRQRRELFGGRRYDAGPTGQDTFVVSTFAINPKLLNNNTHTERYSVFAKLTEGVLQEYYEKYDQEKRANKTVNPNSQIYTESLFNNVIAGVGKLRNEKAAAPVKIKGKSFNEVLSEFQSESLHEEEEKKAGDDSADLVELGSRPRAGLHGDGESSETGDGRRLINGSHYLMTDATVLQRVIASKALFKKMVPQVMLLPTITLEEGTASEHVKFPGFRTFVFFTPRSSIHGGRVEKFENASIIGGEALRWAAILLSEVNKHSPPYPMT